VHRTFPFHDLGDDEFQSLVSAICHEILGIGTLVFSKGKDGGRDAKFSGTAQNFPDKQSPLKGNFIIQAKHTGKPVASCSDSDFGKALADEKENILELIANGELDFYLVFTNRKIPADDAVAKVEALKALGCKDAYLIGIPQLREWLTLHPEIWSKLGYDRFEGPIKFDVDDITTVISQFHAEMKSGELEICAANLNYVAKSEKNKINKLSDEYWSEVRTRSLQYFKAIEEFLKNPRNLDFKDMYEDTADEIRRKLLTMDVPFKSFDDALTFIIDFVTKGNTQLKNRRRFATVFLHYMYYTCDIGQHADTDQAH